MKNSFKSFLISSSKSKNRRKPAGIVTRRAGISFVTVFLFTGVLFLAGAGVATAYLLQISSELPRLEREAISAPAQTTKIYSKEGNLIASLHAEENRIVVSFDKISHWAKKAIIAIEDERFYKHKGLDVEAIARALFVDIRAGEIKQGGSTITQQYVRNIYLTREKTIERKIKEALLAFEVEKQYSKDTILEKYLNTVYFGHGCYGIETASNNFFGKTAKDLTLSEASLLAGLVRGPNIYSPYKNIEAATARRNLVLKRMLDLGFIDNEQYQSALNEPIVLKELPRENYYDAEYFVEYVTQMLIDKYGVDQVFKGGLRVYTTIDLRLQHAAEQAVFETLNKPNDPSASLTAIDVNTGHILAMVGGRDFEKEKFNLAVQGKRQPGSAFKTFVLVSALQQGISPYSTYKSSPLTIKLPGDDWQVSNAEGGGRVPLTLRDATVHSVNAVYARLVMEVGPKSVVEVAKSMGITSNLKPYPSIALGSQSVSSLEMASAYATLASNGKRVVPIAITKVTDSEGRVIDEFKPKQKQVIEPWVAYTVTDILKDAIRKGTGARAKIAWPAAGKTGTAQLYRDAWFCGYTPQISTAVWVGYKEAQIPMRNIHGFARVYGGTLPAIIWKKFMNVAMEGMPVVDFQKPPLEDNVFSLQICSETGLRATLFCPTKKKQVFLKGRAPKDFCNLHKGIELPNLAGMSTNDAILYLQSKNIASTIVTEYSITHASGIVIRHDPPQGTALPEGSSVTLYVSLGHPSPVPVEPTSTPSTPTP